MSGRSEPRVVRRAGACLPVFLVGLILGCSGGGLPEGVVVRIGNQDFRYEDFRGYVEESLGGETSGGDAARFGSVVLSRLFERFVDDHLLVQLARDRGLVGGEATIHEAAMRLLEVSPPDVSSSEIERYYAENRSDFARPPRVRLRQILVQDRSAAELALAELEAGVNFAEVARLRSSGPGASSGGLQGELSREDLPSALAEVVFELGDGEWSELLEADYGFRIFEVERHLPEETLALAEASPAIRALLEEAQGEDLVRAAAAEARRKYNLRVAVERLPFEYDGVLAEPAAGE